MLSNLQNEIIQEQKNLNINPAVLSEVSWILSENRLCHAFHYNCHERSLGEDYC